METVQKHSVNTLTVKPFAQAEERKPDLFGGREAGAGHVQQGGEGEAGEQDTRAVQRHGPGQTQQAKKGAKQ